jgi:hypothetical protein
MIHPRNARDIWIPLVGVGRTGAYTERCGAKRTGNCRCSRDRLDIHMRSSFLLASNALQRSGQRDDPDLYWLPDDRELKQPLLRCRGRIRSAGASSVTKN